MDDRPIPAAQSATFISLFNGIMSLSATLARRGLIDEDDVQSLSDYMARPLDYPDADDVPGIAEYRQRLSSLTEELLHQVRRNPDVPSD